ncbi:hypothetical protein HUJ04_002623 [Dendroctonus ponderosae]|nr:hypothetical protein HUJ04_002623 [Dendroctonus ponderosae]
MPPPPGFPTSFLESFLSSLKYRIKRSSRQDALPQTLVLALQGRTAKEKIYQMLTHLCLKNVFGTPAYLLKKKGLIGNKNGISLVKNA